MFVVGVFTHRLDVVGRLDKPVKAAFNINTLTHRADSNVILFIDPEQQRFIFIVVHGSARLPIFFLKISY